MKWNGPYGMNNTDRPAAEPGFFFEGTGEELYEQLHHNWQRAMQPTPRRQFVGYVTTATEEDRFIEIPDDRPLWVTIDVTPFAPKPRRRWRRLMHILFGDEIIDDPRY